ncbi:FimH protein [Escherichia coli]|nr:FimH protein [Escherichia coli]
MGWSVNAWSFACKTANGTAIPIGGGSANVYVNLAPVVNVGQNLVVDLSTQIFCHNDYPENHYRLCHTATRLGLWRRVI